MTKKTGIILAFLIITKFASSQNVDLHEIKLNGLFCCNLHTALSDISQKHQIAFVYDIDHFKSIKFSAYSMSKPLDVFLDQLCKANKLKYFFEDTNTIRIVDK